MPAAAVIPAPIAYIKVVAVKTPVVEVGARPGDSLPFGDCGLYRRALQRGERAFPSMGGLGNHEGLP